DAEYTFERALVTNPSDSWGGTVLGGSLVGSTSNGADDKSVTYAKIDRSVECDAKGNLVFNLVRPDASFPAKLAFTAAGIIDKKFAVAGGEWDGTAATAPKWFGKSLHESYLSDHASGTGAYQLVRKSPTEYIFKAFPGYWGDKPKLTNVIMKVVPEEATRILAMQRGDADVIDLTNRPSLQQLRGSQGVKVLDDLEGLSVDVVFMNQNIKGKDTLGSGKLDGKGIPADFFKDINVRKGFALAFNYKQFLDQVLLGRGKQLTMALPESFLGYDKSIAAPAYNPEAAKAALKRAWGGKVWENGFTVQVWFNAGNTRRQTIGEILKRGLEELNPKFRVEVVQRPFGELIQKADAGEVAMSIGGWSPDYADPDDYLPIFYKSNGYYANRTGLKDAAIDKALDQAAQITDPAKRESLYKSVGKRAAELYPFILMPARTEFRVISDDLKGFVYNPMLTNSDVYWRELSK
ncbi:MAG TPA: ABC transporter substrate-binding protein, partial [Deinococcales bacterium]|nr:ABC transporter substrate-binding protein [Deinococcales bacterium]